MSASEELRDAAEGIASLARDNVAMTVGVGLLLADVAYRVAVRGAVRRALGMVPQ